MPTQALSAYGIQVRLGDGAAHGALAVSDASNTTPIFVTTATPHGIVDVSIVTVFGATGNLAANGTWVVDATSPTILRLRGSVGSGTYAGGGNVAQVSSFQPIAELTNVQDAGVMADLVDASAHDGSGWSSRVPTLLSSSAIRLSLHLVPDDPTHDPVTGLEHLLLNKLERWFLIVFPDPAKTAWAFSGWVTTHRVQGPVAGLLTADTTITFTDAGYLAGIAG
ncbi:MAG TPA: hypothetical protein VF077_12570 [Nitrospiraceae bacterium]